MLLRIPPPPPVRRRYRPRHDLLEVVVVGAAALTFLIGAATVTSTFRYPVPDVPSDGAPEVTLPAGDVHDALRAVEARALAEGWSQVHLVVDRPQVPRVREVAARCVDVAVAVTPERARDAGGPVVPWPRAAREAVATAAALLSPGC